MWMILRCMVRGYNEILALEPHIEQTPRGIKIFRFSQKSQLLSRYVLARATS